MWNLMSVRRSQKENSAASKIKDWLNISCVYMPLFRPLNNSALTVWSAPAVLSDADAVRAIGCSTIAAACCLPDTWSACFAINLEIQDETNSKGQRGCHMASFSANIYSKLNNLKFWTTKFDFHKPLWNNLFLFHLKLNRKPVTLFYQLSKISRIAF